MLFGFTAPPVYRSTANDPIAIANCQVSFVCIDDLSYLHLQNGTIIKYGMLGWQRCQYVG